jgi:hypothetical protein
MFLPVKMAKKLINEKLRRFIKSGAKSNVKG